MKLLTKEAQMDYNKIVTNVKVYELNESLIAAGYPMRTELANYDNGIQDADIKRANNLIRAVEQDNDAHGQFLTGIRVAFDLTFTVKAWVEAERYRYLEFISSQSSVYRLSKFDLNNSYIEYVDPRMVSIMKELVTDYLEEKDLEKKKEKRLVMLYSNPCGIRLTARMTTNYRCLRNIYKQRKNHTLPEWRVFCQWIETLPMANELLLPKK